jgi:hypothetical protein
VKSVVDVTVIRQKKKNNAVLTFFLCSTFYAMSKKPTPNGLKPDFSFNEMQCKVIKMDQSLMNVPVKDWTNVQVLVSSKMAKSREATNLIPKKATHFPIRKKKPSS